MMTVQKPDARVQAEVARQPVPMIVLGGYLGAGKTTLVNALLRNADGLRVTVLVNDFGSINVDASLIRERSDDVIGLENGCVCCTIGGRLVETLIAIGEREQRPDLLVIEASGVSDPMRIAQVGLLDKAFRLHGIVVAVDACGIDETLADRYVGDIARKQIMAASTLVMTKTDLVTPEALQAVRQRLTELGATQIVVTADHGVVPPAILFPDETLALPGLLSPRPLRASGHALPSGLRSFVWKTDGALDRNRLRAALLMFRGKLLRAKGFVMTSTGGMSEVHVVGSRATFRARPELPVQSSSMVFIGVLSDEEISNFKGALQATRLESSPCFS
ncbi:GTP-binding protein [Pandoraea sputorum]|uniref:CobW family GTP-binding protein n=1 Tax=Pandoraea sputorum TaxID=93222 RepID=UPI001E2D7CCA|nr:CobW family GTP-binding protein [Pandoraea sputorum]MCE4062306.1 GTP-binding protein [Pandoraea sputorum]